MRYNVHKGKYRIIIYELQKMNLRQNCRYNYLKKQLDLLTIGLGLITMLFAVIIFLIIMVA